MRALLLVVVLAGGVVAAAGAEEGKMPQEDSLFRGAGPLKIRSVTADRQEVPRCGKVEFKVDLSATYDNPFDAEQIDLTAHFTAPSGRKLDVPGFLYRPYTRSRAGGREQVEPAGDPGWRVRFAPVEAGEYTYTLSAHDRTGTVTTQPARFRCVEAKSPGFVRVSRDDPHYFAFDDGSPYFALGANVCWAGGAGTYDYDTWFERYAAAGGNYARLWIGPFDLFTLERKAIPGRPDTGLGRIDQADAWRLDYVLNLAERLNIRLMFCIDSFNALRISPPYAYWADNPYNQACGGMLAKPEEFFTDAGARACFRNRLRYLVARWGYSPNVLSWEFWNEVDIIQRYVSPDARAWHEEMSRYLRQLDAWKHLQTTSYAGSGGDPAVDRLPEMDYVQTHSYGLRDIAAGLSDWSRRKHDYGKPHYVGEFGLDAGGPGNDRDPDGLSLHNGLWATMMSGDAGTGMLWWWDNYIHPRNLYPHIAAVAAFAKGIDWPRARFRRAEKVDVAFAARPAQPDRQDLLLEGRAVSWNASPANKPNTFALPRSGKVAGVERLAGLLHGTANHPDLHNPATFEVDYAQAGKFVLNVRGVSGYGGAAVKVTLDGKTALEKEFPNPNPQNNDTMKQYDGPYSIDVPAGKHTIVVEDTGKDWFYVSYRLPGYVESWEPRLRAFALAGDRQVLAWVQQTDHTWSRRADGIQAAPVAGAVLKVGDARPGRYQVELWDTYKGEKLSERQVTVPAGGSLDVPLPEIATDVAVKATLADHVAGYLEETDDIRRADEIEARVAAGTERLYSHDEVWAELDAL